MRRIPAFIIPLLSIACASDGPIVGTWDLTCAVEGGPTTEEVATVDAFGNVDLQTLQDAGLPPMFGSLRYQGRVVDFALNGALVGSSFGVYDGHGWIDEEGATRFRFDLVDLDGDETAWDCR
jgi:hypothetical protein